MSIRVGIVGYGNLGRGVELAVKSAPDMELCGIFTRRDPKSVNAYDKTVNVYSLDEVEKYKNDFDVMVLCGGSAKDLPEQTPYLAKLFNVVDSFDTHAKIPQHFEAVDKAAKEGKKAAVISAGWDPGMFSLNRLYSDSILTDGEDATFWGRGVSQGHSDAIRKIDGVLDARQYTVPIEEAIEKARNGEAKSLTTRDKHLRECYVVAEEGADKARIEHEIVTMPNYFADYNTTVTFMEMDEFKAKHNTMPHGGFVIKTGRTGIAKEHTHIIEYRLKLDSNPEFTASVITALARAAVRLNAEGKNGASTIFDVPPAYLSHKTGEELRKTML